MGRSPFTSHTNKIIIRVLFDTVKEKSGQLRGPLSDSRPPVRRLASRKLPVAPRISMISIASDFAIFHAGKPSA